MAQGHSAAPWLPRHVQDTGDSTVRPRFNTTEQRLHCRLFGHIRGTMGASSRRGWGGLGDGETLLETNKNILLRFNPAKQVDCRGECKCGDPSSGILGANASPLYLLHSIPRPRRSAPPPRARPCAGDRGVPVPAALCRPGPPTRPGLRRAGIEDLQMRILCYVTLKSQAFRKFYRFTWLTNQIEKYVGCCRKTKHMSSRGTKKYGNT